MSIKNLGLQAGLLLGGGLMLTGIFIMSFASSAPGGGIMIVLGLLFFVPGAFITGSTLLAWFTARLYGKLDHAAKRKFRWAVFVILPVAWFAWSAVQSYLYFRPEAVAERERIAAEQARVEAAAQARYDATRESLVGTWKSVNQPSFYVVFDDYGGTYSVENGKVEVHGSYSVQTRTRDESPMFELRRSTRDKLITDTIVQVDESHLVTRLVGDSSQPTSGPDAPVHEFSRVLDTEALPKFDPRTGLVVKPQMQPGAETRLLNGVTHRFFAEPVAVITHGGVVRTGPGLEFSKTTSMYSGDPVALLAITDVETYESLWFQIRYRDGLSGYALGKLLCAADVTIDGLSRDCQSAGPMP